MIRPTPRAAALWASVAVLLSAPTATSRQSSSLTEPALVSRAANAIYDADFARLAALLPDTCPPAPLEACLTLDALGAWWQIALDPESRARDGAFSTKVERAIDAADRWTEREPDRAEAFFYLGAAYGARVQWRVLRGERLSAARDGKRIKDALERALAIDPEFADAHFGIGVYRYYAAVAPAAVRMLRWLFMLPGGDRAAGLAEIAAARSRGTLVRTEADYQLHVIDLWYEHRFDEARALIAQLQARHPRNPLFFTAAIDIAGTYFHDPTTMRLVAEDLLLRARAGLMNEPALAEARARLAMAVALDRLSETDRALEQLEWILAERPQAPAGLVARAASLADRMRERLSNDAYRVALEGWRAFERHDIAAAASKLSHALALDPRDPVARYRYAQALLAANDASGARTALEQTLAVARTLPSSAAAAAAVAISAAHFDLATLLAADGDRAGASAHFDAAQHIFGADPRIVRAAREAGIELARDRARPYEP